MCGCSPAASSFMAGEYRPAHRGRLDQITVEWGALQRSIDRVNLIYPYGLERLIGALRGALQGCTSLRAEAALPPGHLRARETAALLLVDDVQQHGAEALDRLGAGARSEERRVGKECVSTSRSRWSPSH